MEWQRKYILRDDREARKEERSIYNRYGLRSYTSRKARPSFPLIMMFETSALCNIKCIMCPRWNIGRSLKGNMSFSLFKKVLDECAEHEPILPCQITLHYSGEPLLNPQLPRMIKYAKDKGVPFVRLNTNGLLLDEEMSKKIIYSGLDRMTVALEATKEIHEKTRLGSSYDLVSSNIVRFMDLKKRLGSSKPSLWVQMLTSKFTNEEDIVYGIKQWENLVDYVEVTSVSTIGNQVQDMGTILRKRADCDDLWILMAVLWNGDVTVCCVDHDAKLRMGNVCELSVQEVWDNPEWDNLCELHRKRDFSKLPDLCRNCIQKPKIYDRLKVVCTR